MGQHDGKILGVLSKLIWTRGEKRIELLRQGIIWADEDQDVENSVMFRLDLLEQYMFLNRDEDSIRLFNWCLAVYEREPEKIKNQVSDLLWKYKWVANAVPDFPDITWEAMDRMYEDMRRHYKANGFNDRAVYVCRTSAEIDAGRLDAAKASVEKWRSMERDESADCLACELDTYACFLLECGRTDEAFETADPIFRGDKRCTSVPATTYLKFLVPLLQRKETDRAMRYARKARKKFDDLYVSSVGDYLRFTALTLQISEGFTVLAKYFPMAAGAKNKNKLWSFLLGTRLLLRQACEHGQGKIPLGLAASRNGFEGIDAGATAETLLPVVERVCRDIAQQFDKRNGNTHFAQTLPKEDKLLALTCQPRVRHWWWPF
jgi:hypothetical protein